MPLAGYGAEHTPIIPERVLYIRMPPEKIWRLFLIKNFVTFLNIICHNRQRAGGERMKDSEIVRLFLKRDESALDEVSAKYGKFCMSIAENILKNPADSEECVNDAYMKVWESIPPANPELLSAFLAKITKNLALNRYKAEHAEKRGGNSIALSFDELDNYVSGTNSIESDAEVKELLAAVNDFLDELPKKNRLLFVYRYWHCYSTPKLAVRFMMSEHNVIVTLGRIRKKLKTYLQKRGFEI